MGRRPKQVVPQALASSDSGPLTRSQSRQSRAVLDNATNTESAVPEACEVLDSLASLRHSTFDEATHMPALYRLPTDVNTPMCRTVREKGEGGKSALPTGFPDPWEIIDFNDRQGIWQAEPALAKALGEDPRKQLRGTLNNVAGRDTILKPAGLKNLGATCYLNSLLQYLFFNVDFRQGLLNAPTESSAVCALQRVFALLAKGERCTVDPSEFVTAARVDAVEQADATEFSTLLLDWLQRELGQAKGGPSNGGFIPSLFQGEVSQLLACMENSEHTFSRSESFYELRARLTSTSGEGAVEKGMGCDPTEASSSAPRTSKRQSGKRKLPTVRLESLLADTAFPEEMLRGSDRYHCPMCDRKVDARKTIQLTRLPPYLHITIERYHYDLQKGERRKLNHPVSFPCRLQLQMNGPPLPQASGSVPVLQHSQVGQHGALPKRVTYECIGFLEHVSDSAHSGHYTATLFQEDDDAVEAVYAAAAMASAEGREVCGSEPASSSTCLPISEDLPAKRRRCDGADMAAGAPRRGVWWTMDDSTVSAVQWGNATSSGKGDGNNSPSVEPGSAPERIESAAAYLVLYRRSDHKPGQLTAQPGRTNTLPQSLADFVCGTNGTLTRECRDYAEHSVRAERFISERSRTVKTLAQILREEASRRVEPPLSAPSRCRLSVVPRAWWTGFIHGEDRTLKELEAGDMSVRPALYGNMLLGPRSGALQGVLDPIAVWCGEVKFVPTASLEKLRGLGGLDGSLFLDLDSCLNVDACKLVWQLFSEWVKESRAITQLVQGKLNVADARILEQEGRGDEAVWVSKRLFNGWQRVASASAVSGTTAELQAQWRAFLQEAHTARWSQTSTASSSSATAADVDEAEGACTAVNEEGEAAEEDAPENGNEVTLYGDILCEHGLISRTRQAVLVQRADLTKVMHAARAKEQAYASLWPEARRVPRLRCGMRDGSLLGFADVCAECTGQNAGQHAVGSAPTGTRKSGAAADTAKAATRSITVRRRYPGSGVVRKLGLVKVSQSEPPSVVAFKDLVREKFNVPVLRVLVPGANSGASPTELPDTEVVGPGRDNLIVEKDENVPPERESAAFEGSVFRTALA